MIFKLLEEIRPLGNKDHCTLYNSYDHAVEVFAKLSLATNDKSLILTGLLHEVEEKLGEYKLRKCLEIINTAYPREKGIPVGRHHAITIPQFDLSEQVENHLKSYKQSKEMAKKEWFYRILSEEGGHLERLLFVDLTSEARLTHSDIVRENLKHLLLSLEQDA